MSAAPHAGSSDPDPDSLIGRKIGRYVVLEKLGEGGLAKVWKARDDALGRMIALKILDPKLASSSKMMRRFLHEARATATLDHPGIVAIHDCGEDQGFVYIALALVDGENLSEILERSLIPVPEAVRVVAEAADALAYAHARGVIHRDVTSRNIMRARDGRTFVVDFGLALTKWESRLTSTGTVLGTARFMAPEVMSGGDGDERSDLYSLGIVLYEALTGSFPFRGSHDQALVYRVMNTPATPPRRRRPEISTDLETIVLRAIDRDPARRYPDMADLARDLRAVAASSSGPAVLERVPLTPGVSTAPKSIEASQTGDATRPDPLYLGVLPFAGVGPVTDPIGARDGLADRLAVNLSAALANQPGLVIVPARPRGAETAAEPIEIARELGANALLTGNIFQEGATLRVSFRLVDPSRNVYFGGDVVEGSAFSIGELEDRVIESVRRALGVRSSAAQPVKPGLSDPAAEDRYRQATGSLKRYDNEMSIEAAIQRLEALAAHAPDVPRYLAELGRAYLYKYRVTKQRQWFNKAAVIIDRAKRLEPNSVEVQVALGDLLEENGAHDDAIASYQRALDLDRDRIDAWLGIARSQREARRVAQAEEAAQHAIALDPADWRPHNILGELYVRVGKPDQALVHCQQVIALTPDNARGHRNLGSCYYRLNQLDDAARAYRRSLAIQPNVNAYKNLGTCLYNLHDFDQAVVNFKMARDLRPDDPEAWGSLGNVYRWIPGHEAESADALDRAIALAKERLDRNPAEGRLQALLAEWLAGRGRREEAQTAIHRAIDTNPDEIDFMARAVHVYWDIGSRTEAVRWMAEAVSRGYPIAEFERSIELAPLRKDPAYLTILEQARRGAPQHHGRPS